MDAGETHEIGAPGIEATFAAHDGAGHRIRRVPPALGYAALGYRRVYFAGDTDLFPEHRRARARPRRRPAADLGLGAPHSAAGAPRPRRARRKRSRCCARGSASRSTGGRSHAPRGVRMCPPSSPTPARRRPRAAEKAPDVEVRTPLRARRSSSRSVRSGAWSRRAFAAAYSSSVSRSSARRRARRSSSSASVGPAGAFDLGHGNRRAGPGHRGPPAACSARA